MTKLEKTKLPPSQILYDKRPYHYKAMIASACKNIRLAQRSTLLLQFYADQAKGFTPALKLIEKKTGIRGDNVSLVRKDLSDHGLINYDREDRSIFIFFERIQAYSMIHLTGRRLQKAESKNGTFFNHVKPYVYQGKTIGQLIREHSSHTHSILCKECEPVKLSTYMKDWIEKAEKMTELEYIDKVRCLPEYDPQAQKPMIPWEDEGRWMYPFLAT